MARAKKQQQQPEAAALAAAEAATHAAVAAVEQQRKKPRHLRSGRRFADFNAAATNKKKKDKPLVRKHRVMAFMLARNKMLDGTLDNALLWPHITPDYLKMDLRLARGITQISPKAIQDICQDVEAYLTTRANKAGQLATAVRSQKTIKAEDLTSSILQSEQH